MTFSAKEKLHRILNQFSKKIIGTNKEEINNTKNLIEELSSKVLEITNSMQQLSREIGLNKGEINDTKNLIEELNSKIIDATSSISQLTHDISLNKEKQISITEELNQSKLEIALMQGNLTSDLNIIRDTLVSSVSSLSSIPIVNKNTNQFPPRVSIIMPVYNRENLIKYSIQSIMAQTLTEWELIVISDGCTDSTVNIVKSIQKIDKRIKLIEIEKSGVSLARNIGLENASGDIIAYLDSDNRFIPNYIESIVREFDHDLTMTMAYSIIVSTSGIFNKDILWEEWSREKLLKGNFIDINSFSHRKSVYHDLGGFNESMTRLVDWELIIRYTEKASPKRLKLISAFYSTFAGNRISDTEELSKNLDIINSLHRK